MNVVLNRTKIKFVFHQALRKWLVDRGFLTLVDAIKQRRLKEAAKVLLEACE